MFGRRSASDAAEAAAAAEQAEFEAAQGKGRATPKRKEAEALRKKRLAPPRNKKEANALHRERVREQRVKTRAAMSGTGDDRFLPARDQGPVKKLIRNYVDSHRTIGEFLIPAFLLVFVFGILLAQYAAYTPILWIAVLVALAADSVRVLRGVRKAIIDRFGAAGTQGITMYTLMRSWQMRRLRLPKPIVRPGGEY